MCKSKVGAKIFLNVYIDIRKTAPLYKQHLSFRCFAALMQTKKVHSTARVHFFIYPHEGSLLLTACLFLFLRRVNAAAVLKI